MWNLVRIVTHCCRKEAELTVSGITLDHLVGRFEAGVGDLGDGELFMVRLLGRDDRCVGREREVDAGVRHQVSLELRQVYVQRAIKPQ